MKKKLVKFLVFMFILLFAGILFFLLSVSFYEKSEELSNFPLPKSAQLVYKTDNVRGYNWEKASFENGIPVSYKLIIHLNNWRKTEQEGSVTTYTNGKYIIHLLCDRDYIEIIKEL
ncbi:hypothetical protein ACTHOQ_05495 [Solibacillus silvestris]|uniref:hypothetical protein n=1 Tax=Solibacillus silvestris TaxID=76853 RepID=UPI003F80FEC7